LQGAHRLADLRIGRALPTERLTGLFDFRLGLRHRGLRRVQDRLSLLLTGLGVNALVDHFEGARRLLARVLSLGDRSGEHRLRCRDGRG
jgi:hypothetical protein